MAYLSNRDLGMAVRPVRSFMDSWNDPIRVRPKSGKTMRFMDARMTQPYYAKIFDGIEDEYLIMDESTLKDMLGQDFSKEEGKLHRAKCRFCGNDVEVSYTASDELIASLNRKPASFGKKKTGRFAKGRGRR